MSSAPIASIHNPFRTLWDLGFQHLVPIVPHDAEISPRSMLSKRKKARGKSPGIKAQDGLWIGLKDWQHVEPTLSDLDVWFTMTAGVGIRLGRQHDGSFLYAIDADTLDADSSATIRDIVEGLFGLVPVRIGRAPKMLYLIRSSEPLPYKNLAFEHGAVEILGEGRQAVFVGIHPDTGKPYRITRALTALADMPIVSSALLVQCLAELAAALPDAGSVYTEGGAAGSRADVVQERLKGDPDLVRRAIAAIPNTYPGMGYQAWVRVAAALRGACQDDYQLGLELFEEFTDRAELNGTDPTETAHRVYRSIKAPFSVGASWLYEQAEAAAPEQFDKATVWFDGAAVGEEGTGPLFGTSGSSAPAPKKRFVFEPFDQVAESALTSSAKPLVRGLLDQGAMTVLYGESNVGKTFVAMALAYAIARGEPFGGLRTTQGRIVYIAAEGGAGARKRAAALMAKHGPCADFLFLLSPVNLLDPAADLAPLIAGLRNIGPVVLVVADTLSRVMAGGDENSSVDMGALVRHLDAVRAATGAHVMAVHHTGKDLAKGARGHSLLRAATDTEIEVAQGRITVTKQRDLDRSFSSGFDLESVTLGLDSEGDVVTSATIRLRPMGPALTPPDARETALRLVREGEWRRDVRSGESWVGVPVALGLGIVLDSEDAKAQVRDIVNAWIKDGSLSEEIRVDKHRKQRVYVTAEWSVFG